MKVYLNGKMLVRSKEEIEDEYDDSVFGHWKKMKIDTRPKSGFWGIYTWNSKDKLSAENDRLSKKEEGIGVRLEKYNPERKENNQIKFGGLTIPDHYISISGHNSHTNILKKDMMKIINELEKENINCLAGDYDLRPSPGFVPLKDFLVDYRVDMNLARYISPKLKKSIEVEL